MHEQRVTSRLMKYWDNLRKDAEIPAFAKFNSAAVEDIWGQCMLFMVNPGQGKKHYTFYRVGDAVRKMYQEDVVGQVLTPHHASFKGANIIKRIDEVIAHPTPVFDEGQFINKKSKMVKFRSCLLPFGNDDKVSHVIVGLSWREF
jgi:hypothetical protein